MAEQPKTATAATPAPGSQFTKEQIQATVTPLAGGNYKTQLKKVSYAHDALIDIILANPTVTNIQLAEYFGKTKEWISWVRCSDSFQARLAVRKAAVVGPLLLDTFQNRLQALAVQSMDKLNDAMRKDDCPTGVALEALKITARGLGYGGGNGVTINNNSSSVVNSQTNNVVLLPAKAPSAKAWAETYGAEAQGLQATVAQHESVPPLTPALEASVVVDSMDTVPAEVPLGAEPTPPGPSPSTNADALLADFLGSDHVS